MVNALVQMLQQQIDSWATLRHPAVMERFILRNGTAYSGSPLPLDHAKREAKECFKNSTHAAFYYDYTYCEGIAIRKSLPFPIHHAWCLRDGEVVDFTWDEPEDCLYLGVSINRQDLTEELMLNGVYGVLDTGYGLNTRFMFKRDPELQQIVESFMAR